MVSVPPKTFRKSISEKKIYHFSSEYLNTQTPHYFICVSKSQDSMIFMTCCTSQFDTIRRFVESRSLPTETLVYIPKKTNGTPFRKKTYVNCNEIFTYTLDELEEMYICEEIDYSGEITDGKYEEILLGIQKSPLIEEEYKELIPKSIL